MSIWKNPLGKTPPQTFPAPSEAAIGIADRETYLDNLRYICERSIADTRTTEAFRKLINEVEGLRDIVKGRNEWTLIERLRARLNMRRDGLDVASNGFEIASVRIVGETVYVFCLDHENHDAILFKDEASMFPSDTLTIQLRACIGW